MICYKDMTFCASKKHNDCGRILTKKDKLEAERIGLPIAWGYFCDPVVPTSS